MNFLVFGAGAIGTYIGGSLLQVGHGLTILEQPAAFEQLRQQGLVLDLTAGDGAVVRLSPRSVTIHASLAEALQGRPFDFAIFALKSFDTATFLQQVLPFSSQLPPVLCLSNGVENETALASVLGQEKVIAGTVTSSVRRTTVGSIVLERKRGIGIAASHPRSAALCQAMNAAGLNAHLYPRPADMKWSKMLTNLPANATAAILDMTARQVFSHPGLFRLEMRMLAEALAVMQALGLQVIDLPGVPVRLLALGTKLPQAIARPLMKKAIGGGRGGKMPSFHIDLHVGRGMSEVEWLNGAVARFARQQGLAAPVNETLTRILLALTRAEIPLTSFSRQPQKLLEQVDQEA